MRPPHMRASLARRLEATSAYTQAWLRKGLSWGTLIFSTTARISFPFRCIEQSSLTFCVAIHSIAVSYGLWVYVSVQILVDDQSRSITNCLIYDTVKIIYY